MTFAGSGSASGSPGGAYGGISYHQFNPNMGTLESVTVMTYNAGMSGYWTAQNDSQYPSSTLLSMGMAAVIPSLNNLNLGLNPIPSSQVWLQPGIPVYGGPYNQYIIGIQPYTTQQGFSGNTQGQVILTGSDLDQFIGFGGGFLPVNLSAFANLNSGSANVTGFGANFTMYYTFSESQAVVPEPGTYLAGALLLLPFGARLLRKSRG